MSPQDERSSLLLEIESLRRRVAELEEEDMRRLDELELRVQQRTAQLAAANEELKAFSYSVSHDLRAPLRGIDGFSQALIEDYADRLDATGLDYLRRVRAEAQRMGQLIDDLLDLSQVTRAEIHPQRIELGPMASEILDELRWRDPSRQVEIAVGDVPTAEGDGRLLRVMLENLLGNAWKFTSTRPKARIEFGSESCDAGTTAWFVRDNGVGFNPLYAEHLFGAFQRLHSDSEFAGTGIGLATVHRIVTRHGGRVWADAAVDRGATFFFTLGERLRRSSESNLSEGASEVEGSHRR